MSQIWRRAHERTGSWGRMWLVGVVSAYLSLGSIAWSGGSEGSGTAEVLIDRVAVRFSAPEGPGRDRPYFIYERELAFEARLLALADSAFVPRGESFRQHHVQAALERRIAETLLAALPIEPPLPEQLIAQQIDTAQNMVWDSCGGKDRVNAAARIEGISTLEQRALFRRRAVASLYLHQMVAPMLEPSQLELRRVHRSGQGPLADQPFDVAAPMLRRWYIERDLRAALINYYQNARARLSISYL